VDLLLQCSEVHDNLEAAEDMGHPVEMGGADEVEESQQAEAEMV
jgi:hypothetical protein